MTIQNCRPSRRGLLRGAAAMALPARAASGPPNILYLHSHDTGRYIQPYGYDVPTPNLQKLAEGGMMFRRAFDAAPTCSPSRASLLTGCCPHSNGMLGLAHRGFSLNDYSRHILHTLRPRGYHAALAGIQHIARDPQVIGYDQIITRKNRALEAAPEAARFLRQAPRQPFFLDVGFFETHRIFHDPGPAEDPRYSIPPTPIADTPQTRRDMAAFKATARVLDEGIGQVLTALEESGLAANTLVICTTDHGPAFPAMKCNLTGHGTGVFLILRGPGGFTGGKVCDALVSQLDIFPTVCDLLGLAPPAWLEGKSLMPLVRNEAAEVHQEIFGEINYHAAYEPVRSARTARWNYIKRFGGRRKPVLPNCDESPSKELWLANGWRDSTLADEELYDTVLDPGETRNLARAEGYSNPLAEMRGRLDRWMRATADPLLKGPVPAPPGAVANDPDGLSPRETPRPVKVQP